MEMLREGERQKSGKDGEKESGNRRVFDTHVDIIMILAQVGIYLAK